MASSGRLISGNPDFCRACLMLESDSTYSRSSGARSGPSVIERSLVRSMGIEGFGFFASRMARYASKKPIKSSPLLPAP
jgi:hypothetical protein